MDKRESNAVRSHSIKRIYSKTVSTIARSCPMLPGSLRARLMSLSGVRFDDVRTVFVGYDVYLDNLYPELIRIGRHVRITEGAKILTHYIDTEALLSKDWPFRYYTGEVIVEDFVFIGLNTVIVKPVRIGTGAVIGANSVVVADVEPYSIVAGNPARKVGERIRKDQF